jgi:hypothetical protein
MPFPRFALRLALVATLLSASAFAGSSAKELSKARARFQQATELEQAGNFTAALDAFREVGQVKMTPQVRYHIAFCEEKLGRLLAALGGYEFAASDAAKVDKSFEKEVKARADDLRSRIPKLVVTRGEGADTAQIELDGVSLGSSSVGSELKLDPGPHSVTARATGREPFSTTVDLAERDVKTVEVTLAASSGAEPSGPADSGPKDAGGAEKKPSRVLPYVLGGVGIVSLGASGAFFLMKRSAISDLDSQCGPDRHECPPSSQDTIDKAKLYNTVSGVTLAVGVVSLGVAATLLVTQKPSKEKPAAGLRFVPAAPNAHAGASVYGVF